MKPKSLNIISCELHICLHYFTPMILSKVVNYVLLPETCSFQRDALIFTYQFFRPSFSKYIRQASKFHNHFGDFTEKFQETQKAKEDLKMEIIKRSSFRASSDQLGMGFRNEFNEA